jgi:threonine dehydrogenase-like Zn-dependent dehydrogenase
VRLDGLLTHTFRLDDWRAAFAALARQERSGAMKVAFDFR